MYNCSLFIVTTNHKGEGQVSYKYNKHVRQLKSLQIYPYHIILWTKFIKILAVFSSSRLFVLLDRCSCATRVCKPSAIL